MLPVTPLFIADIYFYQDEDTNDTDGSKFNMSKMMYLLCKNLALLSKFWRNRRSNWPSNVAFAMFLSPAESIHVLGMQKSAIGECCAFPEFKIKM